MTSVPISLLRSQLDTTLQLVISLSSAMTADEIIMIRVRLTEASIIMGQSLIALERNNANTNSKLRLRCCRRLLGLRV